MACSENETLKNRKGIIQELSALKAEVDHFQILLESNHTSKVSPEYEKKKITESSNSVIENQIEDFVIISSEKEDKKEVEAVPVSSNSSTLTLNTFNATTTSVTYQPLEVY
nr:uncharacterized protein LOC121114549 isoform X2 [Lepeophtheirus salmonis]